MPSPSLSCDFGVPYYWLFPNSIWAWLDISRRLNWPVSLLQVHSQTSWVGYSHCLHFFYFPTLLLKLLQPAVCTSPLSTRTDLVTKDKTRHVTKPSRYTSLPAPSSAYLVLWPCLLLETGASVGFPPATSLWFLFLFLHRIPFLFPWQPRPPSSLPFAVGILQGLALGSFNSPYTLSLCRLTHSPLLPWLSLPSVCS